MTYDKNELAIIVLDSILGLEYKHKVKILSQVKNPSQLFEFKGNLKQEIEPILGLTQAKIVSLAFDKSYVDMVLKSLEKFKTKCVTYLSNLYPEGLQNINPKPLVLYCNGNENLLKRKDMFAIVGSRKTLPNVCEIVESWSKTLTESGAVLVTGTAGGADMRVIKGALGSGNIISVVAGGRNFVYPSYNKKLIDEVEKFGLVISEQPPEMKSMPYMFPVRNRIIAGLTKGVLIASGEKTSGARHTASFALDYGREVFAIPYSIGITQGELPNDLIKSGAMLCDSVEDILSFLELEKFEEEKIDLEEDELACLNAIKDGISDANLLVEKLNMKTFELAPILSMLEIQGFIVNVGGNRYKAIK